MFPAVNLFLFYPENKKVSMLLCVLPPSLLSPAPWAHLLFWALCNYTDNSLTELLGLYSPSWYRLGQDNTLSEISCPFLPIKLLCKIRAKAQWKLQTSKMVQKVYTKKENPNKISHLWSWNRLIRNPNKYEESSRMRDTDSRVNKLKSSQWIYERKQTRWKIRTLKTNCFLFKSSFYTGKYWRIISSWQGRFKDQH